MVERSLDGDFIAEQAEAQSIMTATSFGHARHHDAHTFISAHRVDSDMRLSCHHFPLLELTSLRPNRNHFTAIIMAALRAKVVRALQFAAVRAFLERLDLQRIVAATHATT